MGGCAAPGPMGGGRGQVLCTAPHRWVQPMESPFMMMVVRVIIVMIMLICRVWIGWRVCGWGAGWRASPPAGLYCT